MTRLRADNLSKIVENGSRRSLKSVHIEFSGRTMTVKPVEPPSCSPAVSNVILIGRDRRGNWIAREQNGLFGGLFVNRAEAIKYALSRTAAISKRSSNCHAKSSLTRDLMRPRKFRRPQWPSLVSHWTRSRSSTP